MHKMYFHFTNAHFPFSYLENVIIAFFRPHCWRKLHQHECTPENTNTKREKVIARVRITSLIRGCGADQINVHSIAHKQKRTRALAMLARITQHNQTGSKSARAKGLKVVASRAHTYSKHTHTTHFHKLIW